MDQTFTQDQLDYFLDRYALKDEEGNPIESSPTQMWDRVATAIGDNEDERTEFRRVLDSFKFVPGGRILAGAGAESEKTFYNCYVIPVETHERQRNRGTFGLGEGIDVGNDSREAIIDTIGTMVDIMSRGGGVGINWSVLRPSGSYLTRISGTSSGPIGWMDVASKAVGEVIQGGSRRGAAMFMLDDWHPDVLKFIEAKKVKGVIENANISVSVSDDLMAAVDGYESGLPDVSDVFIPWVLQFPDTTDPHYNSEWDGDLARWKSNGYRVKDHGTINAIALFRAITESAHASGEPGVVFLGRYNSLSTGKDVERLISVNPCGEQGLGAYSVCNLGALNLDAYVDGSEFLWDQFYDDAGTAIKFLDNAIDKNYYFIPETATQQRKLRRIGLGVMGLADALVRLGIRYGSEESVDFVNDVFAHMKDAAIYSSMEIAREKGPADAWKDDLWNRPYLAEFAHRNGLSPDEMAPLRNLFLLTVAPTGTTSLLAGVNGGIEPFFNLGYQRRDRTGTRWVQPKAIAEHTIAPAGVRLVVPDYVVTAQQVTVEEHIEIQAAVQRWIDSSVSKTINAPAGQTPAETAKAYLLAYKRGLKGLAYYRDGSRSKQVLYHEDPNEVIAKLQAKVEELEAKLAFKERPALVATPFTGGFWKDMPVFYASGHSPECEGEVVHEEGCERCYTCSWTAC